MGGKPHARVPITGGLRRLGLPDHNRGVDTLRRSAARQIFDVLVETRRYDGALRVVQALLHHSTLATTEVYIGLSTEALTRDEFLRTAVLVDPPGHVPGHVADHELRHVLGSAARVSSG